MRQTWYTGSCLAQMAMVGEVQGVAPPVGLFVEPVH